MRIRVALAPALMAALLLGGCAAQKSELKPETKTLVRPGAKVVVDSVTNASGQNPIPDLVQRLQDALGQALQHEALLAPSPPRDSDLHLSIRITHYEPGNAFKRWLIPGYGSTILAIEGELKDAVTGSKVAAIDYSRSVAVGGLYSVGAWSTIISGTANELAKNLKQQIEGAGGDFVLTAKARAQEGVATPPVGDSITVQVGPIDDQRTEQVRIGERFAAFNVKMSDVYLSRNATSYLGEALSDEIQLAGHRVVQSDPDVTVRLRLNKLWVHTPATALYWDVIGELDCDLIFESGTSDAAPITRHYAARKTDRTYVWPSEALMSKVLNACLDDLFAQIRADAAWASIPHRNPK